MAQAVVRYLNNQYVERDNKFYNYPLHTTDIEKMPDKRKIKKELKQISPYNYTGI